MATAPLATDALRQDQRGQERQRQMRPAQGIGASTIRAHPAQPARLDEVAVGGPHGVAVDAHGRDPLAAAALDRVVQSQDHGAALCERVDEEPEQDTAAGTWAPRRPVEDAVDVHEPPPRARPRMRRTLATVRRPGVRIAPISRG